LRKLFDKQLEKATHASGHVDLVALERLVTAAYEEAELDRARTDRSMQLMIGELTEFQAGLEAEIEKRTAQLKKSKRKLRVQNSRFLTALENMSSGLAMFDAHQRLVVCNHVYLDMYHLPRHLGRAGTHLETICRARIAAGTSSGSDDEAYVRDRLRLAARGVDQFGTHYLNDGRVIAATHKAMPGGGWVTMHRDTTELHTMQAELARQAYHDPLTGLPNRTLLYQRLSQAFDALQPDGSFALLCLDLDGFKAINDTLGHASGDKLLQQVSQRLTECTGEAGLVARMGGDEFVAVLANANAAGAAAVATEIIEAIRRPFYLDGHPVAVGVSVGIAMAPRDGETPDRLLKSGDTALYSIKRSRLGGYSFFAPDLAQAIDKRSRMERDLRNALARGEFELYYQPILNLQQQTISGFEALIRWRHPTDGNIPPSDFIPLCEELGLIVPIGEWVIREAFAEAASWPSHLRIAVNVSSVQLDRGNLLSVLVNALGATGLAPDRVEIEITETLFLEKSQAHLDILHELRRLGLRVALDDFGTGYSALGYLLAFPFDKLKIDGSFVRALDSARGALVILQSVADIAKRMGMITTAEGIETAEQLRNVRALGYTEAQGFLISRPMSRDAVHELLDRDLPQPSEEAPRVASGLG